MEYDRAVTQATTQLMILTFAFVSGVVMFTVVAFALGPVFDAQGIEGTGSILRTIVLVMPLVMIPAAVQVFMLQSKRMATFDDWQSRIGVLRGRTIVMSAMFEGPAMFAAVTILLTGFSWHVVPALVLFVAAMGGLVPTRGRVIAAIGKEDGSKPDQYS